MASFYEQRMLRLFERYELSDNARTLLKAYDDAKTGKLDEASLGRLIRVSPSNRAALVSTMVKWCDLYSHLAWVYSLTLELVQML
jgi:hypothetical protein